jgi:putative transposase
MIDRDHDLPLARQAKVLDISRGSVYHKPRLVSPEDLEVMRRIDELHLDHPFAGRRMLRDMLNHEGISAGRRHFATLLKRMGIEAIHRRLNTSKPAPSVSAKRLEGRLASSSLGYGYQRPARADPG